MKKFDFKNLSKKDIFNIVSTVIVALAHVFLIAAIVLAYRYFAIYPSLIASIVGIVVCIVILVDIVFFMGIRYSDKPLKIISLVLAAFIFMGSAFGTFYVGKVNKTIGSVMETGNNSSSSNKKFTETVNGVFSVRGDDASKYTSLKDFAGKTIGYVGETTEGVATVGQQMLKDTGIDYAAIEYQTYDELVTDLYDEKIDAAILLDGYKSLYNRNAEGDGVDLSGVVGTFYDVQTFEKEVEVANTGSNVNISTDPFNILLIGYSRTEIGSPIGLADAIIVASVNPKTYTVSMLSIARDSYVPISCYGGTKDKINSARGTSRACFIETVENYTGMKMDFYMEADYEAVVGVVEALGGIWINNPVTFNLDGIDVPAGSYTATGWQVLEFCRERHHMPGGDFDRQQHQKEVIIAIAEKLIKSGDITLFLNAIEAAGDKFSTNLTLNQLTGMFNMILNTKNYTGLKVSKLIDFQQLRLTGYASWYYNYSMNLPLWIYKIYNGSFEEQMGHAQEILGMNVDTSDQVYTFGFDVNNPYERPQLYQDYYNEEQVDEPMPAYYPNLTGMLYADVVAWAKENKITLDVTFIDRSDPAYNENSHGYVVGQSPRYGMLLSDYPTCKITVMGDGTSNVVGQLLDYSGMNYKDVEQWAIDNGYRYALRQTYVSPGDIDEADNNVVYVVDVDTDDQGEILKIRFYTICDGVIENNSCSMKKAENYVGTKQNSNFLKDGIEYIVVQDKDTSTESDNNKVYQQDSLSGNKVTLHTYKYKAPEHTHSYTSKVTTEPTCDKEGVRTYTCSCGKTYTESIPKLTEGCTVTPPPHTEHTWAETSRTNASCTADGVINYKCSVCGQTKSEKIPATGHNFGADGNAQTCATCGAENPNYVAPHVHDYVANITSEASCEGPGNKHFECSCGAKYDEVIPQITEGCNVQNEEENNNGNEEVTTTPPPASETVESGGETEEGE